MLSSDTQRLDIQNPQHPFVESTEWKRRSFVRTHYARVPPDYQPIIFIPLPTWNFEVPDSATPVTEGDLFGGGDVVISKVKLIDFKIVADSSQLPFKLNFDTPFEEVVGETNIKKIQLQELEFITSFTSKKGGKNRRYKKKYNKTKKNKKTIKGRKQKRTRKQKRNKKI
jgi:predicted transcriptional regulator